MKRKLKSYIAMLLVAIMIFNAAPISAITAYAADDTDYLFIATDRHTNTSIIGTMINNMESDIGENKLEYLGLGGDMVGSGNDHPSYNSSTVLSEVTSATTSLSAANVDIVKSLQANRRSRKE